ncbi:MAG: hypothetical protein QNJ03_16035 [Dinoroseobacter sp.]|nr:hypothetical protein [Dinoroseobacter sp.]
MSRKLLLIPLVLAACGPVTAFDQAGVPVSRLSSDLQTCAATANAEAPPDVQVFYTYERRWRRDYWGGPPRWRYERERDIVDVNERQRAVFLQQCMIARGYRVTQLPRCTSTPAVSFETRLPPVTEQSCVVKVSGVGPVIVTP